MQPEFDEFLGLWRALAREAGSNGLPTRQQITAGQFHQFLPMMLMARWDTGNWVPEIIYCGTRIDELLKRDVTQEPVKAVFEPGPHLKTHLEVAQKVVNDQVGAEIEAEVCIGGGRRIIASQIRVPLAPSNGKPIILSYFQLPPVPQHLAIEGQVVLQDMKFRYFELLPEQFLDL